MLNFALILEFVSNRKITGHSGKKTLCTKLYNAGFEDHMVKLKSGNRSDAVWLYQIPDIKRRKKASDLLTADF